MILMTFDLNREDAKAAKNFCADGTLARFLFTTPSRTSFLRGSVRLQLQGQKS